MDDVDPLMGTVLADTYIVESLLGEGGMGRVYLARHTRIDAKRFAIKVLHEEFARHREALARFKREAEATALISNPYVVGVHDVGTTPDGRPFMASDYLEGEELADRLHREGQLQVGEAVRIVRQVCLGVAAAHERGVIHRDIKPENVFLVGSPQQSTAKLLDFGISRLQNAGGKALTQAGVALGTPDYMSPEQARGKPIDHRADIYALGLLLYVAVTGVSPFEREQPQKSLIALLTEDVPPPSMFEPGVPPQLEAIISRAMTKAPDGRYQSAQELWQVLASFDPTSAAPLSSPASHPAAAAPVSAPVSLSAPAPASAPVSLASGAEPASAAAHGHAAPTGHATATGHAAAAPAASSTGQLAADASGQPAAPAHPAAAATAHSPAASAPTGMAASSPALPTTAELLAERRARKSVMLWAGAGMGATLLALALALGGLARTMRVDLEIGGWAVVTLVAAALVGGGAALARALVLRSWWRGAALGRLQQITTAAVAGGFAGYAFAALLIRLLLIGLLDEPKDLGEPIYDIVLLLAGAIVAAAAGIMVSLRDNATKTT